MYQVFKYTPINSRTSVLQYVAEYATEAEARAKAKEVRGLVKINGTICYDLTNQ